MKVNGEPTDLHLPQEKPSICIIAHRAYGAMCGGKDGYVGGAEHQTSFTARWLAGHGYETSLLTWDEGQPPVSVIDGVKIISICPSEKGLPGLRFFHPRLTGLYAAMRKADADIFYHNSAEYVTGLAADWCRRQGRAFVYSVASDVACDPRLPVMRKAYERVLYRRGLTGARKIIVQTNRQKNALRDGFGLHAVPLPMQCSGPSRQDYEKLSPPEPRRVAWIGRAAPMKRLEWLFSIAEKMPDVTFELAVANENNEYGRNLRDRASALSNVLWRGTVRRADMPAVYQRAMCVCCTSSYEGFPNTFLEAWSYGRPVVSSFDPDELIQRLNLGSTANDVSQFVDTFSELLSSPNVWRQKSENARRYYFDNHRPEAVMPLFVRELVGAWKSLHAEPRSK
ncbi:MAG: glycosyltransferase family 4 protein [Verrucomicrobiales bacterium]|nr:glycosyltransferase family 4 protein [Verrucomicrobiales bacterium]